MLTQTESAVGTGDAGSPPELALILSALETASAAAERRQMQRFSYRVQASLRLLTDSAHSEDKTLYTRDVNARSLGFLTRECLPLGYGGIVRLPSPAPGAEILCIPCTLLRCREVAPGWYDGAMYFNRDREEFADFKGE